MSARENPTVLIIKLGAIGDVVMLLPAAHALHRAGHTIDWVCGVAALPILALYPWIHPIPVDDRALIKGSAPAKLRALWKLWRVLAGHSYGLIAIVYYSRRFRLLTLPVRAKRTLALSHTDRAFRLLPGRHHTDEFARILLDRPDRLNPLPLAPVPIPPGSLPSSPVPRGPRSRVVLAPAGARNLLADDALRRWPAESYVALARLLLEHGIEVVLIGGPEDAWIRAQFASLPVEDCIARFTLPQTLALLEEADLLVTHDTGPLHLAGITRTGIIGIFGPTDPRGRLPQRPGAVALWGGEGFACRPCYDGHTYASCPANDCMRQVSPQWVYDEAIKMLKQRAQGFHAAPCQLTPESTVPAIFVEIKGGN